MRVAAVVLAAGSAVRFGGRPKQFELLDDRTVLEHAVAAFSASDRVHEVWVVTSAEHFERARELLGSLVAGVVTGGATRARSTGRGIDALGPDITHVLVHDAARPLLPISTVDACVDALRTADVVATVVPTDDTVVVLDGERIASTPDRDHVRLHQTPQGFRRDLLARACRADDAPTTTDDVTTVLRIAPEASLAWVSGDRRTRKITHPDDLVIVRALAAAGPAGPG